MTLSTAQSRNSYTGNDAVSVYAYTFKVFLEGDFLITVRDLSVPGVETTLALTTDYTISNLGVSTGGDITLVDAGQDWLTAGGNLKLNYTLVIRRKTAITQPTDIKNQGSFFPVAHENSFDRMTMISQNQQDELDRSVKLPETIGVGVFDPVLPTDIIESAEDKVLAVNDTGDGIKLGPTTASIFAAEAAAAASAANAASSEAAAGVSETNAAASAAAALVSEGAAATSAAEALVSEGDAAGYAADALVSAGDAQDSADAAAISAASVETLFHKTISLDNTDSPYAILAADAGALYIIDASSGNVDLTFPTIAPLPNEIVFGFQREDASGNTVIINRSSTDTIGIFSAATYSLTTQGASVIMASNNTVSPDNWSAMTIGGAGGGGGGALNAQMAVDPAVGNDLTEGYAIHSMWYNTVNNKFFRAEDVSIGAAVWNEIDMIDSATTIAGAKTFSAAVTVTDSTTATSKDTGSIVTEGGVGIEENLHVGGSADIAGAVTITDTTSSTDKDTGSIVTEGGVGIEENLNVGGSVDIVGGLELDGVLTMSDTTSTTDKDSGSIVTEGGIGVEENIHAGGTLRIDDTSTSTSKDTGSIVTEGGLGVEENIHAGGTIRVDDTTSSTDKDTGSIVTEGGVGIEENLNVGGAAEVVGVVTVIDNTDSVSSTTGSLLTAGGMSAELNIHAGGSVTADTTVTATTGANFLADTTFDHITTPANPAAGKLKFYSKADDKFYSLDSSGTETEIGSGGGGGGLTNNQAAVDPAVSNDNTEGYAVHSMWYNTVNNKLFRAEDVSTGAAVWNEVDMIDSATTLVGAKTFSAAVNVTDVTESTTKDTGSIITEGGIGVEKGIVTGLDVTVGDQLFVTSSASFLSETIHDHIATPADPASGELKLYAKSDDKFYALNSDGREAVVGPSSDQDANTIKTFRAHIDGIGAWTNTSINDQLPKFAETDTLASTFEVPTTGSDALLTELDAHSVFHLATASGSINDAVGVDVHIPAYVRGRDVGYQFEYRTWAESANGDDFDFLVYIFDKTNGVETDAVSTGAQSAGASIEVGTTTGMAVGDYILVGETGGANAVSDGYITEVVDGTHIRISFAVNLTAGNNIATGILNPANSSLLSVDDETNNTGTSFKGTVFIPENCTTVTFMVQVVTSSTDKHVYFDNLEFTADPFKMITTVDASEMTQPLRYSVSTVQTVSTGVITFIDFDTRTHGPSSYVLGAGGGKVTVSGTGWRYVAPTAGVYRVTASVGHTDVTTWNPGEQLGCKIYVNGSEVSQAFTRREAANNNTIDVHHSDEVELLLGDIVEIAMNQNSGETITVNASNSFVSISKVESPVTSSAILVNSKTAPPENFFANGHAGYGSTNSFIRYFTNSIQDTTGTLVSMVNDSTLGCILTAKQKCVVNGVHVFNTNSTTRRIAGFTLNPTTSDKSIALASVLESRVIGADRCQNVAGSQATANCAIILNPGDEIAVHVQETQTATDDAFNSVSFTAQAYHEEPIVSIPTISYGTSPEVYRASGFGGFSSNNLRIPYWSTEIENTMGTVCTVVDDSSDGNIFTALQRCVFHATVSMRTSAASAVTRAFTLNTDDADKDVNFSTLTDSKIITSNGTSSSTNNRAELSTVVVLNPGDEVAIHSADTNTPTDVEYNRITVSVIPILDNTNQAAIIAQPVAYVEDRKATTVDGGTSSVTADYRDLNTLSGDTGLVDVSLNGTDDGFVLNSTGKYKINWRSPFYRSDNVATELYNFNGSIALKQGQSAFCGAAVEVSSFSWGSYVGVIQAGTELRIRYEAQTSRASNGLGIDAGSVVSIAQDYELYTQVEITRMQ